MTDSGAIIYLYINYALMEEKVLKINQPNESESRLTMLLCEEECSKSLILTHLKNGPSIPVLNSRIVLDR